MPQLKYTVRESSGFEVWPDGAYAMRILKCESSTSKTGNNPQVVLKPGDTITSTCTFQNDTGGNVAFGPSTKQEMCYQFSFSYPARALENGALGLIGATNVCW